MSINQPLVTVVTVVYNDPIGLEQTIKSVRSQVYSKLEYIVVDGNSTDSTKDILRRYEDSIDVLVSEKDQGIYDAMNKGIALSNGDWINFLNAGDIFCHSQILAKIFRYPLDDYCLVYGNNQEFLEGGMVNKKAYSHKYVFYGMFAHHQTMFYACHLLKQHGLKYDLTYRIGADFDLTQRLLKKCNKAYYLNEPICVFEQGGVSEKKWLVGLLENYQIKIKNFPLFFPLYLLLFPVQLLLLLVKRQVPQFYSLIRGLS